MKQYIILVLLGCTMVLSGGGWAQETDYQASVHQETGHEVAVDCSNPINTLEINDCARQQADDAQVILDKYMAKANEQCHDYPKALEALHLSQRDWLPYRESYCHAIYELWRDGTIRGAMYHGCMLQLTVQRTHNIWQHYLTYMDSSEPILPEPK
ncbi:lysozyme inhibitor LprI family protein [Shewanella psychromarinicola]|uniref:DUF1311 domain-containing protein n=1 Tax=Shewanella psychromarinicola TaxID=2487742 RepID=A0A3N4DM10_9GAMM|nr:lysozyme inhibitor LprI family protein [Shewanella psychromarinicola]AZG35763.1 DUF1311 domain-containing protein [Shewanella psychromarinicola]MCL1083942.1 DUF1311 domain-containing protein [Shewanella psychromarinicola]RPA22650.1 DUF1311 domain-containing protein [Shewanella psychromarinicola]